MIHSKNELYDMLCELENKLESYEHELNTRFKDVEDTPSKEVDLFSFKRGEVNLSKTCAINVIKSVRTLINSLIYDIGDSHVEIKFTEDAFGEFFKKYKGQSEEHERKTVERGKYEHELCESIKKSVNADFVDTFNKHYVNVSKKKYFKEFKKGKNGDTDKKWLFDAIYNQLYIFPKKRIVDCYDKDGQLLGYNDIPFNESEMMWNGAWSDDEGDSVFVFNYSVDSEGMFKFIRVRIADRWFDMFERK